MRSIAVVLALTSSAAAQDFTTYSCDGIPAQTEEASTLVAAQLARWHDLAEHSDGADWRVQVGLAAGSVWNPRDVADRVRLQHEMLEVAHEIDAIRRTGSVTATITHATIMTKIRAFAPTTVALATLGLPAMPQLSNILPGSLVQRATDTCGSGRGIHNEHANGMLSYRPMRSGTTRALVAQIVAFDDTGAPHVTPLVEGIEMRFGEGAAAPACVVRAGADGVLRPLPLAAIDYSKEKTFIRRFGDGVGCVNCHGNYNVFNVRDISGKELLDIEALRGGQVIGLAQHRWEYLNETIMNW